MPFAVTWKDPEIVILSEVSHNEKDKYHQFSSVAQLCPIICDPIDCSMPGFPAHHQLPEFTQIHIH